VSLVVSRQEIVEELENNSLEQRQNKPTAGASSNSNSTVPNSEESEGFSSISPDLRHHNQQLDDHNDYSSGGEVIFPWKHREILTLDIPVHDTERAGLGVSVKGKTTGGGAKGIVDLGIFVKNVINGGAASRDGRLRTNDQLVNINGISLLGKANCDAMDTLRRAMHEEGPTPGVITLTVARRLNIEAASGGGTAAQNSSESAAAARRRATGRDSVTSMLTSSSEGDSYREYRIGGQENTSRLSMNNSSLTDTSTTSQNDTVIYVEKKPQLLPPSQQQQQPFDNFLAPAAVPRNPVVDRLMGRKEHPVDAGLRNESYYRATGHDTWNATMMQQHLDTTDSGGNNRFQSPTVHKVGGREAVIIEQYAEGGRKSQSNLRPHSPDGCEGFSERSSKMSDSDVAYASQTSLEEASFMFARDQPGRQSMSEKRHATLDAKSTDTYQRSKRARQEREKTTGPEKGPIGPMLGMKKSSSLESLQTMMTEMKMESGRQANRVKTSKVVRGRGCNESFRAAVDRSYEAQDCDDQPGHLFLLPSYL
jgi:partitioning defective protein 3